MFNLPFEDANVSSKSGVFKIKASHFSPNVAYLTDNSVSIVATDKIDCPILFSFERSTESVEKYGPNSWIEWIDAGTIAFGTFEGSVFISKITENGEVLEPKQHNFDFSIIETTVLHTHLVLFKSNSEFLIISRDFEVLKSFNFNLGTCRVSCTEAYGPHLSGLMGDSIFVAYIDENSVKTDGDLMYNVTKYSNINIIAYNPRNNCYAVATRDEKVFIMTGDSFQPQCINVCENEGNATKMFFINEYRILLVFFNNRKCLSYNVETGEKFFVENNKLNNAVDLEIDVYQQQIFITNFKVVSSLFITKSTAIWVYTPLMLLEPFHNKMIAAVEDDLPKELYPIRTIASKDQYKAVLSNLNGFVILNEESIGPYVKQKVNNLAFVDDYLFVFSNAGKGKYDITVYNDDSTKIKIFTIGITPKKLSSRNNRIAIASEDEFIIITINETETKKDKIVANRDDKRPPELTNKYQIKLGNDTMEIKEYHSAFDISEVCFPDDDSFVVLYNDETAYIYPENKLVRKDVKALVSIDMLPIIAMQSNESTIILFNGKLFGFHQFFSFFDDYRFSALLEKQEFGEIQIKPVEYSPHFINFFANKEVTDYLIDFYTGHPRFDAIFTEALNIAVNIGKLKEVIKSFSSLDDTVFTSIFCNFYDLITEEKRQKVNKIPGEIWTRIFNSDATVDQLGLIIVNINVNSLSSILKYSTKSSHKKEIASNLLYRGFYTHAAIFSQINKMDMPLEIIANQNEEYAFEGLLNDKQRFPAPMFTAAVKFLIDQCNKYNFVSLAKVAAFILGTDKTKVKLSEEDIKKYTKIVESINLNKEKKE